MVQLFQSNHKWNQPEKNQIGKTKWPRNSYQYKNGVKSTDKCQFKTARMCFNLEYSISVNGSFVLCFDFYSSERSCFFMHTVTGILYCIYLTSIHRVYIRILIFVLLFCYVFKTAGIKNSQNVKQSSDEVSDKVLKTLILSSQTIQLCHLQTIYQSNQEIEYQL